MRLESKTFIRLIFLQIANDVNRHSQRYLVMMCSIFLAFVSLCCSRGPPTEALFGFCCKRVESTAQNMKQLDPITQMTHVTKTSDLSFYWSHLWPDFSTAIFWIFEKLNITYSVTGIDCCCKVILFSSIDSIYHIFPVPYTISPSLKRSLISEIIGSILFAILMSKKWATACMQFHAILFFSWRRIVVARVVPLQNQQLVTSCLIELKLYRLLCIDRKQLSWIIILHFHDWSSPLVRQRISFYWLVQFRQMQKQNKLWTIYTFSSPQQEWKILFQQEDTRNSSLLILFSRSLHCHVDRLSLSIHDSCYCDLILQSTWELK